MPLQLIRNDLSKMAVDAIVNPSDTELSGSGGLDRVIREAGGPELEAACRALGGCGVGEVRLTEGYRLPCRYVIHTVGPRWRGGSFGEREKLEACYRGALELAKETGCESIAFPLIAAGTFGWPKDRALRIAMDSIGAFLLEQEMQVYLVLYDGESLCLGKKLVSELREYIDDNYVEAYRPYRRYSAAADDVCFSIAAAPTERQKRRGQTQPPAPQAAPSSAELERLLDARDESFQEMLLRRIDESGMTDVQCYKRANIDRKLFAKIRKNPLYKPSKATALAFAVALRMDLAETEELLRKAGYALSHSSKFDLIVEYCIGRKIYDIYTINEALFSYDQNLLGG